MDNQAPLQPPQQNRPLEKTVPIIQGLKLLRLPPPKSPPAPVREAWGPNQHKPTLYRRSESYDRHAEPTGQPPQGNMNQYSTQTKDYTSSHRRREIQAVHLPPPPSAAGGFPLLRLPPGFQIRPIQLPGIPLLAPVRLHTAGTVAKGIFPKPQLLHVEPEPSRIVSTTHIFGCFMVLSLWVI